jgi:hypothetical protein
VCQILGKARDRCPHLQTGRMGALHPSCLTASDGGDTDA